MQLHPEQKILYIRQEQFNHKDGNYRKYKDPCHFTGKYRSVAHSISNIRILSPRKIPIDIHSDLKYDFHLIIKDLPEKYGSNDFDCLGQNTKRYISFLSLRASSQKS